MRGCPRCGADYYFCLEIKPDTGEPDYDGPKECDACGEVWV